MKRRLACGAALALRLGSVDIADDATFTTDDADADRGGRGGRGRRSGHSKPRVPGGPSRDDPSDIAEHPECRRCPPVVPRLTTVPRTHPVRGAFVRVRTSAEGVTNFRTKIRGPRVSLAGLLAQPCEAAPPALPAHAPLMQTCVARSPVPHHGCAASSLRGTSEMPHTASGKRIRQVLAGLVVAAALVGAGGAAAQDGATPPAYALEQFGAPPPVPTGPLTEDLARAVATVFVETAQSRTWGRDQSLALSEIAASGDPRLAWLISDLMRFAASQGLTRELSAAAGQLMGTPVPDINQWGFVTDRLIAWDIPAPPDYLTAKRAIFTGIIPGWDRLFVPGDIDWRLVSWGGVLIDDRAYDTTDAPCNCIPAADNPPVQPASEATWLDDDDIVFGIEVNGEYRAYPRQIMEVREMVNDTLGGRDLGIPYCTLCGSAQAYFTDTMPEGVARPILRTSGLLIRSNKVMYDLNTFSIFDTFRGHAVTGPLAEIGLRLDQASVVTTEWGAWKEAHPETTVLAERLALGRDPDFRNGRDANGPIFPVGDVDPRLPVHEDVIGVLTASGTPIAFQRSQAMAALRSGADITFEDVRLVLDAGGIRAVGLDGADLGSHQAFWFAWSQFHPGTQLWPG